MYHNLAVLATFALLLSFFAGRLERGSVTSPMVYIGFGLVAGPVGLHVLDLDVGAIEMRVIADVTLALVLFVDAANADLRVLKSYAGIPARMLLIGLPLCIALGGALGGWIFPEISLWEAFLLATMLAATDAALVKGVVSNTSVPEQVRQGLNAESGLNDGLAVPVLFVFLALATGDASGGLGLKLLLEELGIGIAVAVVVVTAAVHMIRFSSARGWVTDVWLRISVVPLALSCFALAQTLQGSGFIACFVGGLLFGYFGKESTHKLVLAGEGIGELMAMLTWVVFGAVFMWPFLGQVTWEIALYAILSLTLIRMLPMLIALLRTGEPLEHRLFLAWFGPRGLASIVFLVIVGQAQLPANSVFIPSVVLTITLCVLAHGITAYPWANRLARKQ